MTLQYQALPEAVDAAPLDDDNERSEVKYLALVHFLSSLCGSFGAVPFLATMSMIKDFSARPLGPGVVCTILIGEYTDILSLY